MSSRSLLSALRAYPGTFQILQPDERVGRRVLIDLFNSGVSPGAGYLMILETKEENSPETGRKWTCYSVVGKVKRKAGKG